jgi:uncharacterized OB-fold protein
VTDSSGTLELARCLACQVRYLPGDGPCPNCGSSHHERYPAPARGIVLAGTELVHPATGWPSPHRLVLVEVVDSVRLLAIVDPDLPPVGAVVSVRKDGDVYRAFSPNPGHPAASHGPAVKPGGATVGFPGP